MERLFSSDGGIPPMFAESFRESGPEWKRITGINFETVGRILICHLIIEHYLTNLIELETPAEFDWDGSRMTFSQKLNLTKNIHCFKGNHFHRGIDIINRIRNKFSHNLLARIDPNFIKELLGILNDFRSKNESEPIDPNSNEILIVEMFTSTTCAFIAGYCSSKIMVRKGFRPKSEL